MRADSLASLKTWGFRAELQEVPLYVARQQAASAAPQAVNTGERFSFGGFGMQASSLLLDSMAAGPNSKQEVPIAA